ncbi:MAG: carbonate dehydratase [Oscillatoriales cyanobacterium CG2_30_44_21]|nr:MAG: carbonate dehydratase [Oscillatoriales cyanobacterium CG2_30_44_21]
MKRSFLTFAIAISILLIDVSINRPADLAAQNIHWRYGGTENPTQWGRLSKDFELCELGKEQSPINISGAVSSSPADINFDYKPTPLEVINNGHTIEVNYVKGSKATIEGHEYALLQFHFHTPSEHYINGQASPMELHLVHRDQTGHIAVVAIMLNEGISNPIISQIWEHLPALGETNKVEDLLVNVADLLPSKRSYFSYSGSLTTPPCSEGVSWNIFAEPVTISNEQIEVFEQVFQVDARPVQSLNNRTIQLHS